MAVLRCMGCMREYSERRRKCPYCGYEKAYNEEANNSLKTGTILQGRYVVGKTIRFGEQEIVYLGWDQILEKRIAIKEFFPQQLLNRLEKGKLTYLKNDGSMKEFQMEKEHYIEDALELAKFREETGVIRIYDYFEENETVYVITEYSENYGKNDVATRLLYSRRKKKKRITRYMWYWMFGIETMAIVLIIISVMIRQQQAYPFLKNENVKAQQIIPDVVGESYEQAKQELEDLGLEVRRENYLTDIVEEGLVLRQSTGWGMVVQENAVIILIVSKEQKTKTITTESRVENSNLGDKTAGVNSTQTSKKQDSVVTDKKEKLTEEKKEEKQKSEKKKTNEETTGKTTEVIVIED